MATIVQMEKWVDKNNNQSMIEVLLGRFNALYPLSAKLKERLSTVLKVETCQKKDFILKEGQVPLKIWYVIKGLARTYHHAEGLEVNTKFIKEGEFLTSWPAFYRQQPGDDYIQAMEDMELIGFAYKDLQKIYSEFIEFSFIARPFFEYHFLLAEERNAMLRQENAEKRYSYFLQHYHSLNQRIPQRFVASYLGITKETLSRVRTKLFKSK